MSFFDKIKNIKHVEFNTLLFGIIVGVAVIFILWKLIPLSKRTASGIWTKAVGKKNNLGQGEILVASIIIEGLLIFFIIVSMVLLPDRFFLQWGQIALVAGIILTSVIGIVVSPKKIKTTMFLTAIALLVISVIGDFPWAGEQLLSVMILSAEMLALLIVDFLIIYLWWAPNDLYFTIIPEGYGVIVIRAGQFSKVLINWKNHILALQKSDEHDVGDVIEGVSPKRFLGGLTGYGFWPLDNIHLYKFGWIGMEHDGTIREHEKRSLSNVLLMDDIYVARSEQIKDRDGLECNVNTALTMRVVNPYKALFCVQNWLEMIMIRVKASVRDALTQDVYNEWLAKKEDLSARIQDALGASFQEWLDKYGIAVSNLAVPDIDPSREKDLEVTLSKLLGEKAAQKTVAEVSGTVIGIMAVARNLKMSEMREKIRDDEELKKQYDTACLDLVQRRMAIDGKAFRDYRVDGAEGPERTLLNLVAMVRGLGGGKELILPGKEKSDEESQ